MNTQIIVCEMKTIFPILIILLSCGLNSFAQSGALGYGYNYTDSVEVIEVIEVDAIEAVDSLDYVDYSLYGIIKNRDWDRLVLDREQALSVLDNLPSDAYGLNEKASVRKLLMAKNLKITNQELLTYRKVRSIQVSRMGIFSYPYFSCRFKKKDGKLFFEKISGSQRKSGYTYDYIFFIHQFTAYHRCVQTVGKQIRQKVHPIKPKMPQMDYLSLPASAPKEILQCPFTGIVSILFAGRINCSGAFMTSPMV